MSGSVSLPLPPTYEVPTRPAPQIIRTLLGTNEYTLTFRYGGVPGGCWTVDIGDAGNSPLVSGLPLVTGSDLLAQHEYLGIGVVLFVQTDGDPDAVPGFADLGVTGHLYWFLR